VDESIKVDFLGRLMILSGLEYDPTLINRILLQEGLMDAIMRESSFAQYIKQQGIEEGIEEGIEQGGRQRAIEDILEVLEIRFDLSEAHPLSTRIAAIEDLQHLKQLHRAAIQVPNLEAFQRVLDA
jgi:predicted transposase YdaD